MHLLGIVLLLGGAVQGATLVTPRAPPALPKVFSLAEIETYASLCGLSLKVSPTGPYLRIEAFPTASDESIGYLTAFIRPVPQLLFHLESIVVQNRRQTVGFQRNGYSTEGPGISFILGSYALRWAYDRGCRTTQLLAVKDSDSMHQILKRLYGSFGFKILRELSDEAESVVDRLTWGAEGTLMEMNVPSFLEEWTPKLREIIAEKQARQQTQEIDSPSSG